MKRLLLLRHAKSDWAADYAGDHTRPLAKRGRKAARRMGRFLVTADLRPDLVVASTATRARDTAAMAADAGAWADVAVHATDALYEASPEALLGVIRALPDAASTVLLVGHEPTFSMTAGRLIGAAAVAVPTGTLAGVDFEGERWADVTFGAGTLCLLIPPRVLDGLGLKKAADLVNASRNTPDLPPGDDEG